MRVIVLGLLAACGRLDFAAHGDATASDTGLSLDATIFPDGVAAPACGATVLLQDGFDTPGPAPSFAPYTDGMGVSAQEASSRLQLLLASGTGTGSYAGYYSVATYATDGLCASVQLTANLPAAALAYSAIYSGGEVSQKADFVVLDGRLKLSTHVGAAAATVLNVPYEPVAHHFLRLRQQGGVTYWDVSADGAGYSALASATFLTDATLFFEIGGGTYAATTSAGMVTFDDALVTGP